VAGKDRAAAASPRRLSSFVVRQFGRRSAARSGRHLTALHLFSMHSTRDILDRAIKCSAPQSSNGRREREKASSLWDQSTAPGNSKHQRRGRSVQEEEGMETKKGCLAGHMDPRPRP
jgi:hypothetical protein